MNIAIIVAGGTGSRTMQEIPKQFLSVDDKPIIIHTLEKFQSNKNIDRIIVVSLSGWEQVIEVYARQFNLTKVQNIVLAGENRFFSIYNGMKCAKDFAKPDDTIVIYDANRPMISDEIIDDAIVKGKEYGCSCGALPCYDTMFLLQENKSFLADILDRNVVYRGMGPDAVRFDIAIKEFDDYNERGVYEYPLSEMLARKGYKVAISKSSSKCMKITTAEDLEIFISLYESKKYKWLK